MKSHFCSFFSAFALTALGLALTDCQPTPAVGSTSPRVTSAPAPVAKLVFEKYRFGFLQRMRQNREVSEAAGWDRP
jgi:hypothetical protein